MTDKPNQHGGRRAGAGRPSGRPNKEAAKVGGSKQRGESLSELAHRMQFFYQLHQEEGAKGAAADPSLLQESLDSRQRCCCSSSVVLFKVTSAETLKLATTTSCKFQIFLSASRISNPRQVEAERIRGDTAESCGRS